MSLAAIVEQLSASPQWGDFAAEVLEHGPNPRNGSKTDEAHPPIHPLKPVLTGSLQGNDWRVYELVARHFLACVSWDAQGQETTVGLRVGGETFHTTGLYIHDMGYLKVYTYDKWSNKTIPNYMQGEELVDYSLRMTDGRTQPPELLNEADLIALMDKFGIGTDATHAEHIEKIKTRQYVGVRNDGRFVPGFLGLALVDGYDAMGYAMSKPQLRADLERQLQAICAGERTKQEVLREQLEKYRRIFVQTEAKINLVSEALSRYISSNSTLPSVRPPAGTTGRPRMPTTTRRVNRQVDMSNHGQVHDHETLSAIAASVSGRGARGRARGARRGGRSRGSRAGATADQSTGVDVGRKQCACGVAAVQRTVQKDGPNKGKKFWTCSKPMGQPDKCNFFEWL